jgi:hypothetical protein
MSMTRMYHPHLGREIEVPDDEGCIAVHADAGWVLAPEPVARPGYEPEPVTYAPVPQEAPAEPEAPEGRRGKAAKPKPTDS